MKTFRLISATLIASVTLGLTTSCSDDDNGQWYSYDDTSMYIFSY